MKQADNLARPVVAEGGARADGDPNRARAARNDPDLLDALDIAEVRRISRAEIARLRRDVAQGRLRRDRIGIAKLLPRLWQGARIEAITAAAEKPR